MAEIIEIPDFDFTGFYYPDFLRSLIAFTRQNVPEITEERDEEPYTQLLRSFSLVGHLNNVLLDIAANETLLPSARLLESVRGQLSLIGVTLQQAKPASADLVVEMSKVLEATTNFIPIGTQFATEETEDTPQIIYEADADNSVEATNQFSGIFAYDAPFVHFFDNTFEAGDSITVNGVEFKPSVDFAVGVDVTTTAENFKEAINISSNTAIENQIYAFRSNNRVVIQPLNTDLTTVPITSNDDDNTNISIYDQTTGGTDSEMSEFTHKIADDFTPVSTLNINNAVFSLKRVGSPLGSIRLNIQGDDGGGDPDGVSVGLSNAITLSSINTSFVDVDFTFDTKPTLTGSSTYWFVLEYVDGSSNINAIPEQSTVNLTGQVGSDYDVSGNALSWLIYSALDATTYRVWYNVTDGGNSQSDPTGGGETGIQVDVLAADDDESLATKTKSAMDGIAVADMTSTISDAILTITNANPGSATDTVDVDANVTVNNVEQGSLNQIVCDGSGAGSSRKFETSWSTETSELVLEIFQNRVNFEVRSGGFGLNKIGESSLPGVTFPMFNLTPIEGSTFYFTHNSIMWDTIGFDFENFGAGINGAFEFYNSETQDKNPNSVTNLGSNLEMDLTDLLGNVDRSGSLITVTFSGNSATEQVQSIFENSVNIVRTRGLLGQSSVSTLKNDYLVGTNWNEISSLTDDTLNLTADGNAVYELPQNLTQNWSTKSINTFNGFTIRYRIISVDEDTLVNPIVDSISITEGKQFLLFSATQGETKSENPLGSSDGSGNQEFTLGFQPLITDSLVIEVDEGSGFTAWSKKDNFLTSTQISKDYVLEVKADDTAIVEMGDGESGKIPAIGVDNIRATYRIGADNDGNVGSKTITINKSGVAFVTQVFNPRAATGYAAKEGSTDEDLARLKIEGPATVRVRGRGISPSDFEFLAEQFTSSTGSSPVTRALAIEETFGPKSIELVVVGPGGIILTQDQRDEISEYFNGNKVTGVDGVGLANHEVITVNYTPKVIDVVATVSGGVASEIENALTSLLNPEAKFSDGVTNRWDFEDVVPLAIISSTIIEVDSSNIKNVSITSPAADVQLGTRELPLIGNISITVV